jgi:hypothetical protein
MAFPTARAQDRLPETEALRYAAMVDSVQAGLRNTPGAVNVDLKRPVAHRDGDYGLMILPAATLSAETFAHIGAESVPIGQLWLLKLAPLLDGQVIANDQLRMVEVSGSEGTATVPCCHLGVRQASAGGLDLLVFGKGQEPILTTPLKPIAARQSTPIDVEVERQSDSGRVTLKLAGRYAAVIAVTDPELY